MNVIQFEEFSVFYKVKRDYYVALNKIHLDVAEGEFLAIVGPSGCGKTTLLRSVMGLSKVTTGSLRVNGREIETLDISQQNIGYVSQEYNLYPSMTVYENIAYPLNMMGTAPGEIDKRVKRIAQQTGISFLLTRKPRQLSGGQQQRLAIARALVKNPRILLLDEPFSNLGPESKSGLCEMLKQYHQEQRPTILFVTHDFGEALALADRIVFLEEAEIRETASPEALEPEKIAEYLA